jgi:heterodisulfide reductase subunit C
MKKSKLSLNRETLNLLNAKELEKVNGGATPDPTETCSTCGSCTSECGTRHPMIK